jgi:hypothetical protein
MRYAEGGLLTAEAEPAGTRPLQAPGRRPSQRSGQPRQLAAGGPVTGSPGRDSTEPAGARPLSGLGPNRALTPNHAGLILFASYPNKKQDSAL